MNGRPGGGRGAELRDWRKRSGVRQSVDGSGEGATRQAGCGAAKRQGAKAGDHLPIAPSTALPQSTLSWPAPCVPVELPAGGLSAAAPPGGPPESTPRARATQRSDTPTAWCLAPPRHMAAPARALQHVAAGQRSGPAQTSGGGSPCQLPGAPASRGQDPRAADTGPSFIVRAKDDFYSSRPPARSFRGLILPL